MSPTAHGLPVAVSHPSSSEDIFAQLTLVLRGGASVSRVCVSFWELSHTYDTYRLQQRLYQSPMRYITLRKCPHALMF